MTRAMIIGTRPELNCQLLRALYQLQSVRTVHLTKAISIRTTFLQCCGRISRQSFLPERNRRRSASLAQRLRDLAPGISVIAFGQPPDADALTALFDSGVTEFLGVPFPEETVTAALSRFTRRCSVAAI